MDEEMIKVIGVRFRSSGKVYYFDPKDNELRQGMHVIVETARGIEYGTVVGRIMELPQEKIPQALRPVIRIATTEDDDRARINQDREKEAMAICREKIVNRGLDMKLIDAEYTFDNNKILFYFTADGRVDFRELVKDLAAVFRMRIELRQIGVRDETKILGGIGICGRPLCCHTWLSDFVPVSIRMAKEQSLSLNPTKISGVCGRLMCCLKNEEETYEYLNSKLPSVGDTVTTSDGRHGEVHSVSVLRQQVKVLMEINDEKEILEFDVSDLKFRPRKRKDRRDLREQLEAEGDIDPKEEEEDLHELEEMEEMEVKEHQTLADGPDREDVSAFNKKKRQKPERAQTTGKTPGYQKRGSGEGRQRPLEQPAADEGGTGDEAAGGNTGFSRKQKKEPGKVSFRDKRGSSGDRRRDVPQQDPEKGQQSQQFQDPEKRQQSQQFQDPDKRPQNQQYQDRGQVRPDAEDFAGDGETGAGQGKSHGKSRGKKYGKFAPRGRAAGRSAEERVPSDSE